MRVIGNNSWKPSQLLVAFDEKSINILFQLGQTGGKDQVQFIPDTG
jgi:hypothetical protein